MRNRFQKVFTLFTFIFFIFVSFSAIEWTTPKILFRTSCTVSNLNSHYASKSILKIKSTLTGGKIDFFHSLTSHMKVITNLMRIIKSYWKECFGPWTCSCNEETFWHFQHYNRMINKKKYGVDLLRILQFMVIKRCVKYIKINVECYQKGFMI